MSPWLAFAWGLLLGAVVGMVYAAWVARMRRNRSIADGHCVDCPGPHVRHEHQVFPDVPTVEEGGG